jgi:hypothetical protein
MAFAPVQEAASVALLQYWLDTFVQDKVNTTAVVLATAKTLRRLTFVQVPSWTETYR